MSGRTLGQRASKVRVNNEGEHIRMGPPANPFTSTGHLGSKQSTLNLSQHPDVPVFQHHPSAAVRPGDISDSSGFSGHTAASDFWLKKGNTSHAASIGQPQTSGFGGN